jgi:hypothetical protein
MYWEPVDYPIGSEGGDKIRVTFTNGKVATIDQSRF